MVNSYEDIAARDRVCSVVFLDNKGIVQKWNDGAVVINGFSSADAVGSDFRNYFTKEQRDKLLPDKLLEEATKNGKASFSGWRVRKDGTVYWADITMNPVCNDEGSIVGFTKITLDLTASKNQFEFEHSNLAALINNLSGLIWSVNLDFKLISSNAAFTASVKSYSGKVISEGDCILDKDFIPRLSPDILDTYRRYYERAFAGEIFTDIIYYDLQPPAWYEISFTPIIVDGKVIGTACYSQDITQRKVAELHLHNSEHRFRSLIENSSDAVAIFSADEKLMYVSPSVTSILGYTEDELMQMDVLTIIKPETIELRDRLIEKVIANPGIPIKGFTKQMLHKSGHWVWLESTMTNMLHDPSINGLVDNFRDITAKKLAEEQLKHRELRLKQSQAIAHLGSWELDLKNHVAVWSDEHCRIYGVPVGENTHTFKSWLNFIHPDERDTIARLVNDSREKHEGFSFHHRIVRPDGTVKQLYTESNFDFDENGSPVSLYGISHDVTSLKEIEEKLLKANRLLAFKNQLNQAISQVHDDATLFQVACKKAVDLGKFELAWIGRVDASHRKVDILASLNKSTFDLAFFTTFGYSENGPTATVLQTGIPQFINNHTALKDNNERSRYALSHGFESTIILPLKKAGKTVYTLNLFSREANFFKDEEVSLLAEAADDISFALDVFETEKLRKDAENKLRSNEIRLKQAQELANFGNWELNFSTNIVTLSDVACRIIGLSPDENKITGEEWLATIHPDDRPRVMKTLEEAKNDLLPINIYHRILKKNGEIRFVHAHAQYEFFDRQMLVGLHGVMHDVTEIREAQDALMAHRNQEKRFQTLSNEILTILNGGLPLKELITEVLQVIKADSELAAVGMRLKKGDDFPYFAQIGFPDSFLATENSLVTFDECGELILQPDGTPRLACICGLAISGSDDLKGALLTPAGSFWTNDTRSLLEIPTGIDPRSMPRNKCIHFGFGSFAIIPIKLNGEIVGTLQLNSTEKGAFNTDIIQFFERISLNIGIAINRRQTEEALKENAGFLKETQIIARLGTYALDITRNTWVCSEICDEIFGIDKDYKKQMETWLDIVHPDQRKMMLDYFVNEVIGKRQKFDKEYKIVRVSDQTERWVHGFGSLKYNDKDELTTMVGAIVDITASKKADEERNEMLADIVLRNKDLEQFSYIISHNLRSPVANIIGITDLLASEDGLTEKEGQIVAMLSKSVNKLDEVITDINYVLQVKHQVNEKKEPVKLSDLLADINISIDSLLKSEDVQIISDFSAVNEIISIKSYFYSILFNLISNSIKYRRPGVHPVIEIRSAIKDGHVELTIRDNGLGIDLAKRGAQVFGLYKRFHSHVEGKGMGLFMVKTQVEVLGGKITVESEVNKGTIFHIVFDNLQHG